MPEHMHFLRVNAPFEHQLLWNLMTWTMAQPPLKKLSRKNMEILRRKGVSKLEPAARLGSHEAWALDRHGTY